MPLLRFFAPIDSSPYGVIALAHLDALRAITAHRFIENTTEIEYPIRLIASTFVSGTELRSREAAPWARHRDLTGTPLRKEFLNIVCCEPDRWDGLHVSKMIRARPKAPEYASGCQKNVLILTSILGCSVGAVQAIPRYDITLNKAQVEAVELALKADPSADVSALRRKVNVQALREAIGIRPASAPAEELPLAQTR